MGPYVDELLYLFSLVVILKWLILRNRPFFRRIVHHFLGELSITATSEYITRNALARVQLQIQIPNVCPGLTSPQLWFGWVLYLVNT